MASGGSGTMEMAALGRPFGLGMLYDCRSDSLIPGNTLWDRRDLLKDIGERQQNFNDFEIVASESIEDKSKALNVEASLKASLFSGLVQVGGSAKYLNENKTSKNQARVTLQYKATTKFQELSMDHLGRGNMKYPEVFEKGLATHVVTAILYGAQAFFVFDREVSGSETREEIEGNLNVMIKKIPCLAIEGEGELKMEDKDKENAEKFSCKFFGDLFLPHPPTSYQEAIQVYQSLPTLLGANGEKAVPMKVWLLPLTNLDSSAAKLVRQISLRLVQESQSVLEDFSELEIRCNDALKTDAAQKFSQISKKIKTFKEMCSEFKMGFQQSLAKKLRLIRGGGEEEAGLAEILKKRRSSPFNTNKLNEWMDCKEKEMYSLLTFTRNMKNTKILRSQTDLLQEVSSADHAVCFVFTSLGGAEPYLSELSDYLNETPKPDKPSHTRSQEVRAEQWYDLEEVLNTMSHQARLFSDFAEANKENKNIKFLTVGLTNEAQKGSTIYLYQDGRSINKNFGPPSEPETVTVSDINHNSVTLKISPPKSGAEDIISYSVEFCVSGEEGWKEKIEPKAEEVTVSDLNPDTQYKFRCRAVTSVGVGPANDVREPIKTKPEPRSNTTKIKVNDAVRRKSTLIEPQTGSLSVYKVPLTKEEINVSGCRCFTFGEKSTKPNRTILVLGATGAGKSTLINGMINYILGVEWEDSYRFKLVHEDPSKSQAHSQTAEVTVYKINHREGFKIHHSLTIVDTPGFGDTRGIERDGEIKDQLHNVFTADHGVTEIDAVCFVVQASLPRLTPTQKYVFDSVLSIFGNDVEENIRVLVTFADGQRPPVLDAIKEARVPCPTEKGVALHYKFNNSALFADNKPPAAQSRSDSEEEGFDRMFWIMGEKSMKRFFAALNIMNSKSLTLTKQVLAERKQLEVSIESLQTQVKVGLAKLEEMRQTSEQLKTHEAEIKRNKNFVITINVSKPFKSDISGNGNFITNCQQCNITCHYPCQIPNDDGKSRCWAMGPDEYCEQCALRNKKCHWSDHVNQTFRWEYKDVRETQTVEDLKKKYMDATVSKAPVEALMANLRTAYGKVQTRVETLVKKTAECLNRLKEIALRPNPLSTTDYIDMLIQAEKSEGKPGYKSRIQSLTAMRKNAEYMDKVAKGQKFF